MSYLDIPTDWNKLLSSAGQTTHDSGSGLLSDESSDSESLLSFFIPDLTVGGAERVVVTIINGLADRGYNVELVLSEQKGQLRSQLATDISVVELSPEPYQPLGVTANLPALALYLQHKEPAALFPHLRQASVVALGAQQLTTTETAVIPTHHAASGFSTTNTIKNKLVDQLVSVLYPKADHIIAVSECVRDSLVDNLSVTADSISVLYNPVDIESIQRRTQRPASHDWIRDTDTPVVLFVGRIAEQKNLETWLQAFKQVHTRNPATRGVIVGEGPERENIGNFASKIGISDAVDLPGYVDNPYQYMDQADVFLLSSNLEGLPTVLIEALACGCPIVSTDCPCGPREILDEGRYGHLAPTGDADALADAVTATLSDPTDEETLRGRAEDFSPASIIDGYERFIRAEVTNSNRIV